MAWDGSVLVASDGGLWLDGRSVGFRGRAVTSLALDGDGCLVVVEGSEVSRMRADRVALPVGTVYGERVTCVGSFGGRVVVGTSGAHLMTVGAGGGALIDDFEAAPGRETWFTPWGAPPDVRSLDEGPDGLRWVSVHVGGVLVSRGSGWRQTVDIDVDVHQVRAHPHRAGVAVAAAAVGLGVTTDGGSTWRWSDKGLDAPYARAVAVSGDLVLISASRGPGGGGAAVYRGEIAGPLERCTDRYAGNIDTGWVAASGSRAAFVTRDGSVMVSSDLGESWEEAFRVDGPRGLALLGDDSDAGGGRRRWFRRARTGSRR
jgi:hypothetical protein